MYYLDLINHWFGSPGQELTYLHVTMRCVFMVIFSILVLKIGAIRLIGGHSPLDTVQLMILASVMSRGINGTAPFTQTVLASFLIVVMHWLLAKIAYYSHTAGKFLKGESQLLFKKGIPQETTLSKCCVTIEDLRGAARINGANDLKDINSIILERSGQYSVQIKE